jgi:5'-3' exoribonuclease 1
MLQFNAALQTWLEVKVAAGGIWGNFKVVMSGVDVPGEGEHKIMDWIRQHREEGLSRRHCIYSPDADIFMLSLITHEPYTMILRERVTFGNKKEPERKTAPVLQNPLVLVFMNIFREYL